MIAKYSVKGMRTWISEIEFRKASNMTAKELAQNIELSPSFISAIENNASKLSLATLNRICDTLGVTLSEFFNEQASVVDTKLLSVIKNMPEEKNGNS